MTDDDKKALKALLTTILVGQTAGGLNGLANANQSKKRRSDVRKVEEYAKEILYSSGIV